MDANLRTGGHILIEQLALHGADTVFGVPGESFLAALDGMYQSQRVRFINARHEGGAAMMADAYGKLTGRPGIAFATRGPGGLVFKVADLRALSAEMAPEVLLQAVAILGDARPRRGVVHRAVRRFVSAETTRRAVKMGPLVLERSGRWLRV